MARSVARSVLDCVRATFWIVSVVFAVAFSGPVLGEIEGRVFPVVRDFRVTHIDAEPVSVRMAGTINKVRGCEYISLTAYIGRQYSLMTLRERLDIVFHDQPADLSDTRLPGLQAWGIWEVIRPAFVNGPDVWIEVRHRCHALWETVTPLLHKDAHRLFGMEPDIMDLDQVPGILRRG